MLQVQVSLVHQCFVAIAPRRHRAVLHHLALSNRRKFAAKETTTTTTKKLQKLCAQKKQKS